MENPNYEEAVRQESDREVWRAWYQSISIWNLKNIETLDPGPEPTRPDRTVENALLEPPDLFDFLALMERCFQVAPETYLDQLKSFESLKSFTLQGGSEGVPPFVGISLQRNRRPIGTRKPDAYEILARQGEEEYKG